jgi:hypothetical protein
MCPILHHYLANDCSVCGACFFATTELTVALGWVDNADAAEPDQGQGRGVHRPLSRWHYCRPGGAALPLHLIVKLNMRPSSSGPMCHFQEPTSGK